MDDTTQRVFKLAQECIEELRKKVEYIELLEQYIEELENGLEVPAVKSVQLEQSLEMEKANDNMDNRRPSVMRNRKSEKTDQGTTRPRSQEPDRVSDSDGGDPSIASSTDNSDGE